MKKTASPSTDSPETLPNIADLTNPSLESERYASHIFTIRPDVDTSSLLVHAAETLASLNVMSTDFAFEFEGSRRNVALGIQQLASLAELLVNRALDDLAPPSGSPLALSKSNH